MKLYKKLAKEFNINPKALKRKMKLSSVSTSEIHPLPIVEIIYKYSPDLMYCRESDFDGTIEFQNNYLVKKLIKLHTSLAKALN